MDAFLDTKFEPSGKVYGNDRILLPQFLDYIFRELGNIISKGKEDLAHTPGISKFLQTEKE